MSATPPELDADEPPVVVVLPTLNGAAFIGEQLAALFDQTCSVPWQLVVVDGGSTDDTVAVVESFRPTPVPMRVVRLNGAPGVNAGVNAGVAASRSRLVLIAEHDDVVGAGWLEALVEALAAHWIVGTPIDKSLLNESIVLGSRKKFAEDVVLLVPIADSTGMGFRRELWDRLGGFDESYRYGGNDAEFCFRAHAAGHAVHLVDGVVMHYRLRDEVAATFGQARAYGVSTVRLFREFGPGYFDRRSARCVSKELLRLGWWMVRGVVDRSYRLRFAYRGGLQFGYIEGSLRYRRWFP